VHARTQISDALDEGDSSRFKEAGFFNAGLIRLKANEMVLSPAGSRSSVWFLALSP